MSDFERPKSGFRFSFGGIHLADRPDAVPPGKYVLAQNIRAYASNTIRTRPGQVSRFTTGGAPITDIGSYASLDTDDRPRYLAHDTADRIWLDNSVLVGTLSPSATGLAATMIPFRPSQSPVPFLYIANGADYQKYNAPDILGSVQPNNVGIAEPQVPPEAAPSLLGFTEFIAGSSKWSHAGTAGAITDGTRQSVIVGGVYPDPVTPNHYVIQTGGAGADPEFQVGELVEIDYGGGIGVVFYVVEDVLPPITQDPTPLAIQSIYYYTGSTGRCVIVPTQMPENAAIPTFDGNAPGSDSAFKEDILASLRRGTLVFLNESEIVMVLSASRGPNNTVSFECSTNITHVAGESIIGIPAIAVSNTGYANLADALGLTLDSRQLASTISTGVGILTLPFAGSTEPFYWIFVNNPVAPQADDLFHIALYVDDPTKLTEIKVLLDVGDGTFTRDYYYYAFRPSDLTGALANTSTQLAAAQTITQRAEIDAEIAAADPSQVHSIRSASGGQLAPGASGWTDISFPISSFTRVGGDQSKSLVNASALRIIVNASATVAFRWGSTWTGGGGQPNVGDAGSPYYYRVRPRSSLTGVRGNPSPSTRYGVNPRRQPVIVALPSAAYDAQIDYWDIERFGGAVTSWRLVGSTPVAESTFLDNYDDDAALAGEALDFDNFEPWPTVDLPLNATASQVTGTTAQVTLPPGTLVERYLPGNLVQLGGANVYTLWTRPTLLSGTNYLFQFVENAGAMTDAPLVITEPATARQRLPYMWGPDASGTVFAAGDPLRPGQLYFCKNYAPDSAPDTYNIEIVPPSEPLLGGEVLDGLAFVASPERWWALYPQPGNAAQRYNIVQQPFPRGLAAPFGHCTDGVTLWWWAKDGIQSSTKGSLTDADLYTLFPHDGVDGSDYTYNGVTIHPPDYSRAITFRLAHVNGILYAAYQDSGGVVRNLIYDTRRGAWSVDQYATTPVSVFYHPAQQAGTLSATSTRYDEMVMGDVAGRVSAQQDDTNDLDGAIPVVLAPGEWDGGDLRAPKQWGDVFLDLLPAAAAGVTATPMSLGGAAAAPSIIPASATRQRLPVSVGGIIVSDFLGLFLSWTDDFNAQSTHTRVYIWHPSYVVQPARTIAWATFGTGYGLDGYKHIPEVLIAWVSTTPITLQITTVDGQSPAAVTIPSSAGVYAKALFRIPANKGLLYKLAFSSAAPFQVFEDDCEIRVGAWSRQGWYATMKNTGGPTVANAAI